MIKPAGIAVVAASCFALAFALVGSPAAQGQQEEPKNLKVLPKGTSHREVANIMRGMSSALGVRCDECHAQNKAGNDMGRVIMRDRAESLAGELQVSPRTGGGTQVDLRFPIAPPARPASPEGKP